MDPAAKNKQFAESLGADFPILSDESKAAARAYDVLLPIVGVARRWTFYIGADGTILDIDKQVNVDTAGADVAARLDALGIGPGR